MFFSVDLRSTSPSLFMKIQSLRPSPVSNCIALWVWFHLLFLVPALCSRPSHIPVLISYPRTFALPILLFRTLFSWGSSMGCSIPPAVCSAVTQQGLLCLPHRFFYPLILPCTLIVSISMLLTSMLYLVSDPFTHALVQFYAIVYHSPFCLLPILQ